MLVHQNNSYIHSSIVFPDLCQRATGFIYIRLAPSAQTVHRLHVSLQRWSIVFFACWCHLPAENKLCVSCRYFPCRLSSVCTNSKGLSLPVPLLTLSHAGIQIKITIIFSKRKYKPYDEPKKKLAYVYFNALRHAYNNISTLLDL